MSRALLLDFGGTLDSDGLHWSTQFARAFEAAGLGVERGALDRAFLAADRELCAEPDVAALGLEEHVTRQAGLMLERLGLGTGQRDVVARAFVERSREHLRRSRDLLLARSGGCRFGLVSNFTPNLHRIVAEEGLGDLLEVVACSETEGVSKPDPELFRRALARLGASAARAAMVGDSLASDIAPAHALGLRTCWIRGDRVFVAADEGSADHVVSSLDEALCTLAGAGFFEGDV